MDEYHTETTVTEAEAIIRRECGGIDGSRRGVA
jgi:hypothetical protein